MKIIIGNKHNRMKNTDPVEELNRRTPRDGNQPWGEGPAPKAKPKGAKPAKLPEGGTGRG